MLLWRGATSLILICCVHRSMSRCPICPRNICWILVSLRILIGGTELADILMEGNKKIEPPGSVSPSLAGITLTMAEWRKISSLFSSITTPTITLCSWMISLMMALWKSPRGTLIQSVSQEIESNLLKIIRGNLHCITSSILPTIFVMIRTFK